MHSRGYEFRKWIEAGYRDYGKDPWFFIRELAQNSRDAGASAIWVKIGYTPAKEEWLAFEDDGSGMSYDHAVRYLFRLYASSKANEKYAAGLFGIGFWTVLRFNPKKVLIESWFHQESWGVMVDVEADLDTTRITGHLKRQGTRITLFRGRVEKSAEEFHLQTRAALERYCSYLRRNTRGAEPLPVYFCGENITREMKLPGPVSITFNHGSQEGAVGLDPQPRVRLYARGLPVWEGNSLEELSHIPPSPPAEKKNPGEMDLGHGLAPVFLLNGNRLEVNISRKKVIDNRHLEKLRLTAEKVLTQMVEAAADCVSPRSPSRQLFDMMKRTTRSISRSFVKILLVCLLVILPLEYFLIRAFQESSRTRESAAVVSLRVEKEYYTGASVKTTKPVRAPDLTYSPPLTAWFKLFTADKYQPETGFLQAMDKEEKHAFLPVPASPNPKDSVSIELNLRETGKIFLPQPVGHRVEFNSLTLDRGPLVWTHYTSGEVVVMVPSPGILRYRCYPVGGAEMVTLSPARRSKLLEAPGHLSLPLPLEKLLRESAPLGIRERVETALRLTTGVLKYDDSEETVEKYSRLAAHKDWFQKVITIGAGDCDILNGVTALLLRKMGVPARLVIGLVGEKGRVLPGLHAWVEYFDSEKGWRVIDATRYIPGKPIDQQREWLSYPYGRLEDSPRPPGRTLPGSGKRKIPYSLLFYSLMGVLLLLSVALFFIISRLKKVGRSNKSQEFRRVQEDLAGMVLHELLHPGAWGSVGGIRDFKLIPTLNHKGGPISLAQALKWGTQGKLFTWNARAHQDDGAKALGDWLKNSAVPILDSGNWAFAPLIGILPGAVHLERIFRLKAVAPEKVLSQPLSQLVAAVNQRLQVVNRDIPPVLLAPGLVAGDMYDVDLSLLPSLQGWGIPNRFIAVNPGSSRLKKLAGLSRENPSLAQFRLITILLKESGLIPVPLAAVIEKVSRQLVKS